MIQTVNFPKDRFLQPQTTCSNVGDRSLTQVFAEALCQTIDYPRFDRIVFAGDRVALAVLDSLQNPAQYVEAAVLAISSLNVDLELFVVGSPASAVDWSEFESRVAALVSPGLRLSCQLHDPADRNAVACIAINSAGEPIFINRFLFDADVVIPIGSFRSTDPPQAVSIFPQFSSAAALKRFRDGKKPAAELEQEVAFANQNIGAAFVILTVNAPGGTLKSVLCGHRAEILNRATAESGDSWNLIQQAEGEVVVATIESTAPSQTWDQFFRAIQAAAAATANVRQIVVCTELQESPTAAQRRILELQFETNHETIRRRIASVPDWLQGIPEILRDTSVYLHSRLEQSQVEELGLGHVESEADIQRIVDRAASGLLLRDAHLCRIV